MTAQENDNYTIDELIDWLESTIPFTDDDFPEKSIYKIALASLKSHKAGYQMYTYDYSERDWLPAECELTRLLEELSDDSN